MPDPFRTAGRAVAAPLGALARWRHGKPMHPRGVVLDAVLERTGGPAGVDVPWPAGPGEQPATVRLSRGAGLPAPLPDVLGLAVRVPGPDGPVDLLLSTAGLGRLTRRVPVPRRDATGPYSSIMGYRSAAGPVLLAATAGPGARPVVAEPGPVADAARAGRLGFTLAAAPGAGEWRPFARLRLLGPLPDGDPDLHFDAVRHPPPGLVPDGPMARFRAPAYAAAQEARGRG
ncbi:phosphodiesterase [Geodermatophilus sp. DSM 45219]|uniref:phosphodiesterase n=1 Tax=Geodermatophilus sp. DSM 45219 TaxID=1881103 RepID=UPI00088F4D21|nr:phosphodiesterase [Geodermatophilus sp. DSM 45219]SDN96594.1 hypothetical protein SAMN05428965_2140 [Geodermatophilus sp. DSM 45219]